MVASPRGACSRDGMHRGFDRRNAPEIANEQPRQPSNPALSTGGPHETILSRILFALPMYALRCARRSWPSRRRTESAGELRRRRLADGDQSEGDRVVEVPRVREGEHRSVVEFVAPATEKGKYLLMMRDAMWIYMPSASRPIRISPLQRLWDRRRTVTWRGRTSPSITTRPPSPARTHLGARARGEGPSIAYARIKLWVDKKTNSRRAPTSTSSAES